MKVLWVCNIIFPDLAQHLGLPIPFGGGWMIGLKNALNILDTNLELCIVCPYSKEKLVYYREGKVLYCATPKDEMKKFFPSIVNDFKPDIVHLHGTEYSYGKALMDACPNLKYVVSIQGLLSVYAEHYMGYLPLEQVRRKSIRDVIKQGSLIQGQKNFIKGGKREKEVLQRADAIIGRTLWDKVCAYQISPVGKYFSCNEILRDDFYSGSWRIEDCRRYTILVSQGNVPLKGLHLALKALAIIKRDFPDVHMYIAGYTTLNKNDLKTKIKRTGYQKYLLELIEKFGLQNNITFTGTLSSREMKEHLLKSHVFLLPSSIENSPNSLGEAMILGVPSVASYVGGVYDMMSPEEGFLYPADEYYMAAYFIEEIFKNDKVAKQLSSNAKQRAKNTHSRRINAQIMLDIYETVMGK